MKRINQNEGTGIGIPNNIGSPIVNQQASSPRASQGNQSSIGNESNSIIGRQVENSEKDDAKLIRIEMYELRDLISNTNPSLNSLKVVLTTFDELNQFLKLISENPRAAFIKRIEELDFGQINLGSTSETCMLSVTLPESLNHLKKLFVGDIGWKFTVNLPRTLDCLTELHIGTIRNVIKIPRELPCLKKLVIGGTTANAQFQLPYSLANLEELILGSVNVPFGLPNQLDNLRILMIDGIHTQFNIPCQLDNLASLAIKGFGVEFTFPISLRSLETLEIGESYGDSYFVLPKSIPTLVSLKVGEVFGNNLLTLPISLESLKTLEIELGEHNGENHLVLSQSYYNLEDLIINKRKASFECTNGRKKFSIEGLCDDVAPDAVTRELLKEINKRVNENNESGSEENENNNSDNSQPHRKEKCCIM